MGILAVTGGTGKSGTVFLKYLTENKLQVAAAFPDGIRLLVRSVNKAEEWLDKLPSAECLAGVLTDKCYLSKALQDVDTVVHIAGIHWSREVVQAAVHNHVQRLILVHTTGIYSKYKYAGEEYRQIDDFVYHTCHQHGIKLTILRPTMIYGNICDNNVIVFIKMMDKLPFMPVVNGGHYKLQPVHYEDLGRAYYDVLMHEDITAGYDFNLSGGAEIELRGMLLAIGQQLGKKVRFISCPYPLAYAGAWGLYLLTLGKVDLRERVQRLCEPRVYSHAAAAKAWGYQPCLFPEGVKAEVRAYQEQK